ncbi:MFS transporter [Streptomyces sp. NRRL S-87]|uniref:MFS transporter n=1 Tax=Streptomyces sp. NRRL S-87 TaxID=1463920 RepID=UPI00069092CF|nr:MFS transporter [Streptomyces sp. NRRL S-87]
MRILPPPGPARLLIAAQLGSSVGDGAYYVTSALYFTTVVGLSPAQIGLGLALGWAVGSLAGVPLGALADRRGPRGTSVLLALATAAAVGSFLLARSYAAFAVAAVAYATAQCGLAAARQALLAALVDRAGRTGVLARLQATGNAGLAVGAALGGLALHAGTRGAYLGVFALDALAFLLCALLLHRLPVASAGGAPAADPAGTATGVRNATAAPAGPRIAVLRDRPYTVLTLLNAVLLLRMPLLTLALPLWIVRRTDAPGWLVSGLFVLNTLAVTLFQVRTARAVTDRTTAVRAVRSSGRLMLAACLVYAVSAAGLPGWGAAAVLVAGSVLHVVGEMRHSAGSWQLAFDLAPADLMGQYQGFFGTGLALARTLGPLVLTSLLLVWGIPGWVLLGGVFAAAGWAVGPVARWAAGGAADGGPAVGARAGRVLVPGPATPAGARPSRPPG